MGLKVLLVEDNPDHALLTKRALSRDERIAQVEVCADGPETLAHLSRSASPPDVMVLDIRLPGMSGFELLERIKATPVLDRIPVVLLSTSARESEVNHGFELGACAFISKPLRVDDLMARLVDAGVLRAEEPRGARPGGRPPAPETRT